MQSLSGYLPEITPSECIKVKHPSIDSKNLTNKLIIGQIFAIDVLAKILPIIGHNLETVQDRR